LKLGEALWGWALCENCRNGGSCGDVDCPSRRLTRLVRYFEYYRNWTASYECENLFDQAPLLSKHDDLFALINELKSNPRCTRSGLAEKLFGATTDATLQSDQDRAINLAVKAMFMINCASQRRDLNLVEQGTNQAIWRDDVLFSQFIIDLFPTTDHPDINSNDDNFHPSVDMKTALNAKKLRKHAGLKFKATDDLRSHLKLNSKSGEVEIFHHSAFLKEHLRLTKDQPQNMPPADQLTL
jgi:hypothetical protein